MIIILIAKRRPGCHHHHSNRSGRSRQDSRVELDALSASEGMASTSWPYLHILRMRSLDEQSYPLAVAAKAEDGGIALLSLFSVLAIRSRIRHCSCTGRPPRVLMSSEIITNYLRLFTAGISTKLERRKPKKRSKQESPTHKKKQSLAGIFMYFSNEVA